MNPPQRTRDRVAALWPKMSSPSGGYVEPSGSQLMDLHVQEQGIAGDAAAWYIEGFPVSEGESALEGVTQIKGDIGFHYVTMCLTVLKA